MTMSELKIAIDTSVLVGLMNPTDHWHPTAVQLSGAIQTAAWQLVLFDCVIAEAVSVLARRLHEKKKTAQVTAVLTEIENRFPPESLTYTLPDVPQLYAAALQLVQPLSR